LLFFSSIFYLQGLYGRLDKDFVFQTTVTNVEPTAKQSRVLNPYVREHAFFPTFGLPANIVIFCFAVPSHGHRP